MHAHATEATTSPPRSLQGNLGVTAVTFMVIAAAAPLTVVGGIVPVGMLSGNGLGLPVMFIVATIILLLFAVGLTAMSRAIPQVGSFFTFVLHGLGRTPGLATAYLAVICYSTVQLAVFAYLGGTLSSSIVLLGGPQIPWWLITLIGVAIIGYLGYHHIELSSKVLFVALAAEMGIVLLLGVVVILRGGAEGVTFGSFLMQNVLSGAPALGLMFALASFIGFESTVVYRDEVRRPERTIPLATYVSAIVIGVFYAFSAWIVIVAFGERNVLAEAAADPSTLITRVTERYLGPVGAVAIAVLFLGSMFAAVLSLHNVLARYFHTMSNIGVLHRRLGEVHRRHASPHVAAVAQVTIAAALVVVVAIIGFTPEQVFSWFAGIGTLAIVVLMAMTSLAVIVFFARHGVLRSPWHTVFAPGIAFVALTAAAVLIAANFPLLVGDVDSDGNPTWGVPSVALLAIVVAAPLIGVVQAIVLRTTSRNRYIALVELRES